MEQLHPLLNYAQKYSICQPRRSYSKRHSPIDFEHTCHDDPLRSLACHARWSAPTSIR